MTDIDPSSTTEPTAPVPGPDLTALARTALLEVTPDSTVGASVGTVDEGDGVVSVLFANRMPGYPGWRWTVSIAQVEGDEPSVLEVELMPGDGSLVAPEWVPWSERLAEYRAGQDTEDAHDDEADDESDDDDFDGEDDDEDDDEDDEDDDSDEDEDDASDEDEDDDDSDDDFDTDEDDLDESDDDDIDGVDVDELDTDTDTVTDDTEEDDDDEDDAPQPFRGARRRTRRVRPVDPDEDLEADQLDAGETDPDRHHS
ncbi:DUF3027 domain-containing protein [Curtobacterium sp. MCPF17_002]|uniref:DUF3027 domain-containing protein n=1 Tax=Curtobacterium sp. MCPF17_002 TaxID=2175645 RepID=UPI000DA90BB8|nr:DUF3027 domain-containing protein [Curtobacterium sp. MCPF17_002]WIB77123.1 DUF3027 domain-containing protein [Curtobacterium sp. MCPF17_002]